MLQPSEVTASKLLPTIRARLAQELLETHKLKQVRVAKALGITQAAVSHYNTKSRGLDEDLIRRFPEIDEFAADLAARIAYGLPQTEQVARINEFLAGIMGTVRFCEYHKEVSDIDPECAVCFPSAPMP
jgi:predicted transcriptional regulator